MAFRATVIGFAASFILPARAGEVIRPYFLARQAPVEQRGTMTATGAFATIILERLLDIVTVLVLLALFVFVFGTDLAGMNPSLNKQRGPTTLPKCFGRMLRRC